MIINGADLPWCYMSGMKTGVGLLAKPERGHQQILFSKSHVQAGQNRQSEQSRALGRPAGWGLRAKPTPGTLLVGVGLWAMAGKAYHSLRLCPVPTGRGNMGQAESKGQGSLVNGYKSGMCFPIHTDPFAGDSDFTGRRCLSTVPAQSLDDYSVTETHGPFPESQG